MAPLNGVDGDKNGAPRFFNWQKQKMAPYGANDAIWRNRHIWRHMAGALYSGAIWRQMAIAPYFYGAIWRLHQIFYGAIWRLRHMAPFKWRHIAPFKMAPYGAILNGAIFILSNGAVNGDI